MKNKRKTKKDQRLEFLETQLVNNTIAMKEGGKRKHWSHHDLKRVQPMTESQRMLQEAYHQGNHIVASGFAGTGKSYFSLYLALTDVLSKQSEREKIILVRSAAQTKAIGFLPGTLMEKLEPYEAPYKDIAHDLLGRPSSYDDLKDAGVLTFMCTSLIRGLSWDNTVIIVDEAQSMTAHELDTVITRVGKNSMLIICGDVTQNDLIYNKYEVSGFADTLKVLGSMSTIDVVEFSENDILRSAFVKEYIIAKQNMRK